MRKLATAGIASVTILLSNSSPHGSILVGFTAEGTGPAGNTAVAHRNVKLFTCTSFGDGSNESHNVGKAAALKIA